MLIVRIWEGLGNQMFQYAFARALSLRGRREVKLDVNRIFDDRYTEGNIDRAYGLNAFQIQLCEANQQDLEHYSFLGCKSLLDQSRFFLATHYLGKYQFYEETKKNFSPHYFYFSRNCYIKGWFQNEGYFRRYRKSLLEEFVPKKEIEISRQLRTILQSQKTVSIHFRRGDYVKNSAVLPVAYYQNCFRYIQGCIGNDCTYIVFTDDPAWVKKHIAFPADTYYVSEKENLKDYEELILMSRCKHNVIANSTFSWWGAWLNQNPDKVVIAPKRWFLKRECKDDVRITPNEWICL